MRTIGRGLRAAHARAVAAEPAYPEVGATDRPVLPGGEAGYRVFRRRVRIGYGQEVFERAGDCVMGWGVQRGAGFGVHPDAPAVPGATALIVLRLPGLPFPRLVIPCRVVWTVRAAERVGFAYGTLPGHPECGEESFVVGREADGLVWFEVAAFSRPASWYARLGGPLTRLLQDLATRRYLRAVSRAARGGTRQR
ncbi:DUF1990 domain-containing protein [Streptomyces xanthochromogenes]|uniref:DUF1990 family protein n=1 Tax=Streptomyces TaxID=1883 RepID=UPI001E3BE525|nr:DUF1990 domain-containing protein [Streptomyces xanthochromogenes]